MLPAYPKIPDLSELAMKKLSTKTLLDILFWLFMFIAVLGIILLILNCQ